MKKLLFLFVAFWATTVGAQQEKDPTIGLVLSGGGAKGLAHIGALKVIEEAGIQIDYIGGTSMGAIVGSLYAAGYSADQLDSIFDITNFDILIQDELPRAAKTFYEREEAEKYAINLPFDGFNISFPSALSKGQNLYNLLSRLLHHHRDKKNFENLPIPFFCVATDVETGEEVILDSGYLPQAVSASAALPTIFSPFLVDDRLLTDGGIFNNYPVEELRKRGADIIIGVDVQDSLAGRDNLRSIFEILTQINNFRTIRAMETKIGKTDVYINPAISPFNTMSFAQGKKIIKTGEEASRKKMAELKEIAALQTTVKREKIAIPEIDSLNIADVRIYGNHDYPSTYILGKLKLKYPSQVSYRDLNFGINNLSATGNFDMINYQLMPINGNNYVLVLHLRENSNKTMLRLAVHYDDLYKSGALGNLTRKSIFFANDVASLDVVLGDNLRYDFEYYWDKGYNWSLGLKSRYHTFEKALDINFAPNNEELAEVDINRIAVDFEDLTNQIYLQTILYQDLALGIGAEHKFLDIESQTIARREQMFTSTVFDKSHYYSSFGYLKFDSYDNKYFPRKGLFFNADFHFYFYSTNFYDDFTGFSIAKGNLGYSITPVSNFTTRISSGAGLQIGGNEPNSFNFFLGGYGNNFINNIIPFYGYDFLEISGDSYVKGMLELDYEIFRKNHLIVSANYAKVEDKLFDISEEKPSPLFSGYALGYGLETFLGPLEVKYTYSPDQKNSHLFFSLGFWF